MLGVVLTLLGNLSSRRLRMRIPDVKAGYEGDTER